MNDSSEKYNPSIGVHILKSIQGSISVPALEYNDAKELVDSLTGPALPNLNDPDQNKLYVAIGFLETLKLPYDLVYMARLYCNNPAVKDYLILTCLKPYVEGEAQYTEQLEKKLAQIRLPQNSLETAKKIVEVLGLIPYETGQLKESNEQLEFIVNSVAVLETILKEKNIPVGSLHEANNPILELDLPTILCAKLGLE